MTEFWADEYFKEHEELIEIKKLNQKLLEEIIKLEKSLKNRDKWIASQTEEIKRLKKEA